MSENNASNINMADMMQKLSGMFGNKDVPADLSSMFNNFASQNNNNSSTTDNTVNSTANDNSSSNNSNNNYESANFVNQQSNNQSDNENTNPFGNIDIGTILKMKSIMDKMNSKKDDPRSNLLLSLKPYLKPSRKEKVDQYIQLFNMSSIFESLNVSGGEKNK